MTAAVSRTPAKLQNPFADWAEMRRCTDQTKKPRLTDPPLYMTPVEGAARQEVHGGGQVRSVKMSDPCHQDVSDVRKQSGSTTFHSLEAKSVMR